METIKKIINFYKIPLLVSLTTFIAIMAMLLIKDPIDIISVALACLLGTFVMDLDYIMYAYFTDPIEDFSHTLKGYIKHGDYPNAISYVYYHRDEVKEKTLQSVLFQVVLAALTFFMIFAPLNLFTRTIVIATFANSLYRLAERLAEEKHDDWFWMLKVPPSKKSAKIYLAINVLILLIVIQFL
jgi:hypothetical protein